MSQTSYQTTTLHTIEVDDQGMWTYHERVLGTPPLDERKTGENIRDKSKEVLQVY